MYVTYDFWGSFKDKMDQLQDAGYAVHSRPIYSTDYLHTSGWTYKSIWMVPGTVDFNTQGGE